MKTKCKKILATNLESLQKSINDFLKGKSIVLESVKVEQSQYFIDDKHKGLIIDFSLFYQTNTN
jgi:hypothetical protein